MEIMLTSLGEDIRYSILLLVTAESVFDFRPGTWLVIFAFGPKLKAHKFV